MVYITRYAIKKETLKENRFFLKKHQNSYHIGSTKGFAQLVSAIFICTLTVATLIFCSSAISLYDLPSYSSP